LPVVKVLVKVVGTIEAAAKAGPVHLGIDEHVEKFRFLGYLPLKFRRNKVPSPMANECQYCRPSFAR